MALGGPDRVREEIRANGYTAWDVDTARRHGSDALALVKAAMSDEFGEFGPFTSTVENFLAPPGADELADGFRTMLRQVFRKATKPGKGGRKLRTLEHLAMFLDSTVKDDDEQELNPREAGIDQSSSADDLLLWQLDWSEHSKPTTSGASIKPAVGEKPQVKIEDDGSEGAGGVAILSAAKTTVLSPFKNALTPTENLFPPAPTTERIASPIRRTRSENSASFVASPPRLHVHADTKLALKQSRSINSSEQMIICPPIPKSSYPTSPDTSQPPSPLKPVVSPSSSSSRKRARLDPLLDHALVHPVTSHQPSPSPSSRAGSIASSSIERISRKRQRNSLLSLIERADRAKQSSQPLMPPQTSVLSLNIGMSKPQASDTPGLVKREAEDDSLVGVPEVLPHPCLS